LEADSMSNELLGVICLAVGLTIGLAWGRLGGQG
jgi:hypothetical protein